MIHFADWLSPATLGILALALLHFVWQGAALAALGYVVMALFRNAATRYVVAVAVMVLMVSAPVVTFFVLQTQEQTGARASSVEPAVVPAAPSIGFAWFPEKHKPVSRETVPAYFLWLVEAWFAGVMLLSFRSAGGFLVVERLRRRESTPVSEELLELCLSLQRRMGLASVVRYCQCIRLDAPAVAGWIRPVVFLPVTALTGLNAAQLEAVIAHELAHIQRLDAFVNLFQIAVETLLFYHPAVWWLGKRIRAERENCSDDIAVALCGSPLNYARALAHMAEWRTAPVLAMAANHGPLAARVSRLLGTGESAGTFRGASVSAGLVCLSAALLAGSAFIGSARSVHAQPAGSIVAAPSVAAPAHGTSVASASIPRPRITGNAGLVLAPRTPPDQDASSPPSAPPVPAQQPEPSVKPSYLDGLKAAGLTNLSVDELIGLKVQGVTPEYVKSMKDLGVKIDPDSLIGMKVQGITPGYVADMRAATGQTLDADELIGLKVQGVTPEYVKQIHDLGLKADADEIVGMKVQGVTPDYVKSIRALGLRPDADELVGMKVQGITAEYLKGLQAAGFKVDIDEAIGAKVQGITPEFIQKARSHGFKDLTLDQLIRLKETGVLDPEK